MALSTGNSGSGVDYIGTIFNDEASSTLGGIFPTLCRLIHWA